MRVGGGVRVGGGWGGRVLGLGWFGGRGSKVTGKWVFGRAQMSSGCNWCWGPGATSSGVLAKVANSSELTRRGNEVSRD